ncbi:MAG TPA: sigma-70 family RNA polymerase sigma factor [Stackebrandtia sp.]|jgi:RNA polymerase sigma factor (sigma-70 family)|uniref:sigma-70 family RNA polymerase sigma factor n=1 Tax=Stackebrandtia sp. TaxID=2023065 RepID=UPI002D2226C9|nr:sigma-70 family RNA polymerase sigma factor [Stackebrandtia sp.]HZE41885.1 sigma-70 family RNA polymerase sigma factor [Stackebrandtia sp.]
MASQHADEPAPGPNDTVDEPSDAELITATRGGDTTAYGQLYERHVQAAKKLARILARDAAEADDLVSETFAKMLATLRDGRGPDLSFRAYLLTTLRNTFYDRTRRDKKVEFTDDMTRHDPGQEFEDTAVAGQERRYAARAFHRLPERWQMVLWHTEVEGETAAQVAPLLGLTANGVSALAYRARERLRQMYLQEHIADSPAATCRWTADRLGARVRGGLSHRDETKVDDHLEECTACKLLYMELTEVNSSMRGVLAPLVLGAAAPIYLGGAAAKGAIAAAWLAPFAAIGNWFRRGFNWIRRIAQQMGGKGGAIAGGTAAAAAIVALILVAFHTSPPPPPNADEPPSSTSTPPDDKPDKPDKPGDKPGHDKPGPHDKNKPPPGKKPGDKKPPNPDLTVNTDPSGSSLVSGQRGSLPVTIRAPKQQKEKKTTESAHNTVGIPHLDTATASTSLVVKLPEGITSVGGSAGDGWQCLADGSTARCQRGPLSPGSSTVAKVPVSVPLEISGFQVFDVSVSGAGLSGDKQLRVPVAPAGMRTAFASEDATGIGNAGNTLLTCHPEPHCRDGASDNQTSLMHPYHASGAPSGIDRHWGASGANLSLPAGARVMWAGLHWATSGDSAISHVSLATPGGGWHGLGASYSWSGQARPVHESVADVTGMIGGSGTYWVGVDDDQLPCGPMQYAGWSLTVVYQVPGAAPRETAVYEGLAQPRAEDTLSVTLPQSGDTRIDYTLWDGDRSLMGDNLKIDATTVGQAGNLGHGCSASAVEGAGFNTLGVDVGAVSASNSAKSHAVLYTGYDPLEIGVLAVSTSPP